MNDIAVLLLIFLGTIIIISLIYNSYQRSEKILNRWAENSNYEILEHEIRKFWQGPFWYANKWQLVYYVIVKDQTGQIKKGYVKFGNWLLGTFKNIENIEHEESWK